ncbi:hypothetical protein ACFU3O_20770 [Streptomyces antibioticus]|uniref:hypothetical protein n=1 Tax=Streptomyces antibioticus TaxID=1890 RepID=UPI0036738489
MSEIFAGRRGPASLDRLLWLVRVLLSYDDGEETDPPERRDPRLQPWRERWNTLEARRAATRRRSQPAQPPLRPSREDYQQVALVLATLHQRLGSRTVTAMKQLQHRREERRDESANALHKEPSPGDPLASMQRYGPLGTHKGTRSYRSRRSEAREEVLAVYVGIMLVVLLVAGVVRLVQ